MVGYETCIFGSPAGQREVIFHYDALNHLIERKEYVGEEFIPPYESKHSYYDIDWKRVGFFFREVSLVE